MELSLLSWTQHFEVASHSFDPPDSRYIIVEGKWNVERLLFEQRSLNPTDPHLPPPDHFFSNFKYQASALLRNYHLEPRTKVDVEDGSKKPTSVMSDG